MKEGSHWAQLSESTFALGIWLLYWSYRMFGRGPFRALVYPVVALHWLLNRTLRRSSMQYLRRLEAATGAIGHPPDWLDSLRHVALFADTILDKLLAVAGRYPLARVRSNDQRKALYAAAQAGQGGVLVTAHMGCLELCRALADGDRVLKLNILVHTRHAAQFNRILKRLNPDNDVNLLEVSEVGPATAVLLDAKVAAGEYVAIVGDRIPVRASKTATTSFLGHAAPFPVGPWVLASLLKCPVWLLGCIHEGGGYAVHVEKIADRIVLPRQTREQAIVQYLERYVAALTALLVRSPFDWFNFFPFWDQGYEFSPHRT